MLRVAGWTVGLFGAGAAISRLFASPWSEPIVLFALGVAFLFVSRRTGRTRTILASPAHAAAPEPAPAPARAAMPVARAAIPVARAAMPVEQSA
jgi:hypothetical protein